MPKHRDITDKLDAAAENIEEHNGSNFYAKLMVEASELIVKLRSQVADLSIKVASAESKCDDDT
jgi:hypothetical protein